MTTTTATTPEKLPPLRDPTAFVKAMARVASALAVDLVTRAKDARIEPSLLDSYADEKAAGRTGEDFLTWRNAFCDQVAASWVLCTVFVRTLEDRGFLRHRVAGPGAADRLAQFQRMFRFLSERDYLRQVFDALAEPPPSWPRDRPVDDWVGAQVFGRSSAPLWRLSPSAGALSAMLDALRAVDAEGTLIFTFGRPAGVEHDGSTTRFLGDLYQDLNEGVRKRYALLQTPDFVERFILDQTLTPALQERGIAVTVCDPTCGSGHFLLGAYDRLFEARTRQEPGRSVAERARQALSQVYGIDLNPYAAAIARFRLVLSMMDKAALTALEQVPHDLELHIYIDDALLAGKVGVARLGDGARALQQFEFGDSSAGENAGFHKGLGFSFLDPRADALLKQTRFDVVAANPPYITEKDAQKRDKIRAAYPRSAAGTFALSAPFIERVFELTNAGGWTGQITANSFMKREFGKRLIEEFLPSVDVTAVIDTSGAYIPGCGTPTVLLFGRRRPPVARTVRIVRGTRGEPSTPLDPAQGQVWSSIAAHHADIEFESPFISVGVVEREKLMGHPWSLGGGGAAELKDLLDSRAEKRLGDVVEVIGRTTHTGEDQAFVMPGAAFSRRGINRHVPLVEGDAVRDYSISDDQHCFFPYDLVSAAPEPLKTVAEQSYFWPLRSTLKARIDFGQRIEDRGHAWWEQSMFFPNRFRRQTVIVVAEIASHNHFVLDRGGKVFKQSAPVVILPPDAEESDYFALLGYLNSSTVCFYLRQVSTQKQMMGGDSVRHSEKWRVPYQFSASSLAMIPICHMTPVFRARMADLARKITSLSVQYRSLSADRALSENQFDSTEVLTGNLAKNEAIRSSIFRQMVALQEEIDWAVYGALDLAPAELSMLPGPSEISPGERPFEVSSTALENLDGFKICRPSMSGTERQSYEARERFLASNQSDGRLKLIEHADFKRRWIGVQGKFNSNKKDASMAVASAMQGFLLALAEDCFRSQRANPKPLSVGVLAQLVARTDKSQIVGEALAGTSTFDFVSVVAELVFSEAVASSTASVFTETGLEKRRLWEETWSRQRREDLGEAVEIAVPPKYERDDFQNSNAVWRHRGKLDVQKERFLAYPTATPTAGATGESGLVFGWAGWTHLEQLQAAIALWQDEWAEHGNKVVPRATREAADESDPAAVSDRAMREKLLPILQTMVDLLPWVRQWHNDDGETADQFDSYVDEQCRLLDMSRDDVHLWRMPAKVKGPKKKATKKAKATAQAEDE